MSSRAALVCDVVSLVFGLLMLGVGFVDDLYILELLGALVVLGVMFIRRREIAGLFKGKGN